MAPSPADVSVPRDGEPRLLWAIVASSLVHAAAIVAVVFVPGYFRWERSTRAVSYTVDLVASADPAGTNLPAGRPNAKPAPAPAARPPSAAANQPAASAPPIAPKPPVAPPLPEPPPPPVAAPAPPPPPPPPPAPKREVPKPVAEPAQKAEVKLAGATLKPTVPKAKQPEPTAVLARPTVPAVKATVAVARKATAAAVVPTAVVAQKPTPIAAQTAVAKAAGEQQARDKQIAAAVQRRTQEQQIADAVQRRTQEQRIADAVERRAQAAARQGPSGGAEGTAAGGPISIGQGAGSGGVMEGLEMVLYRGQMERRIKENWVWAGDDLGLEVKVQFDVTASGEIRNVRVVGSSGNRSYDASAERAVRAANPLAPPPEKYRDLFVHGVEITFRAQDLQS